MGAGYYRSPTLHGDTIVFVCEDDLWSVPVSGGVARRLTANPGQISSPSFSPDGTQIAFAGRDEGAPEVYLMPAEGGPTQRLTFLNAPLSVVGWTLNGEQIVFASPAGTPFPALHQLYTVSRQSGDLQILPTGSAMSVAFGPAGALVIARHTNELARWKRYRGGLAGAIWIDLEGDGDWRPLAPTPGNMALPQWVADRIYFISDYQGVGNVYSCLPTGGDLRRHTHHSDYYVRGISTDGVRIVYHAGADLFVFDPATNQTKKVAVEFYSSRAQRQRKFVDASRYMYSFDLHPQGQAIALTVRGHPFTLGNWNGPVLQHGENNQVRYRLATWLGDGKRIVVVGDAGNNEALEIHTADANVGSERLADLDIGRPVSLHAAPQGNLLALTNHRYELLLVDLEARTVQMIDRSRYSRIQGVDWSPDGRWLAYAIYLTHSTSIIRLCDVESGKLIDVTTPVLRDSDPTFDPDGKYLYFLSQRDFDPVYDNLQFDLNFPNGSRPYLVTLRADLPSPFKPISIAATPETKPTNEPEPASESKEVPSFQIDLVGISQRVVAFPVPAGRYSQIRGIKGKVLFASQPITGALGQSWVPHTAPPAKKKLEIYDLEELSCEILVDGISSFDVSKDAKTLIYRAGKRLRVLKAGEKPKDDNSIPSRKSGWIDLDRLKVSVDPGAEWEQMYREAWRLQRDHFWTADMSGHDWQAIYQRYLPLLKRVGTRAEFSDLMWEMQGELGTSHAYELGGDYPSSPRYDQGFLGADLAYDAEADCYRIERIIIGDVWDTAASSPLSQPGVNVQPHDRLLAINGRKVGRDCSPGMLLVNQAEQTVLLTVAAADGSAQRNIAVNTLRDEKPARYRAWVEANRQHVHAATDGQVGYVHIPDMGPRGYAEFHRGYLAEVARPGLIVDVRFNGGGHVSQLIIEKLARRRVGYDIQRWGEPESYPSDAVLGPIVGITNEYAGSDGDIFSHVFKLMKIGPLIGKRTWGGVIGINTRDLLVDGGVTTQPEYSFWFKDVGWQVENYGTDPDIEIDITPQAYVAGYDPQLARAIAEAQRLFAADPPALPDFSERPHIAPPALPDA